MRGDLFFITALQSALGKYDFEIGIEMLRHEIALQQLFIGGDFAVGH